MKLARHWGRQTARAAGVSLLAPLVLLGAATLVAAGGGALGGLGSLAQIASGPSLPSTDFAPAPRSRSLGPAQVVALKLGSATGSPRAPRDPSAASGPAGAPSEQPGGSPGGREVALAPGGPQGGAAPRAPSPVGGGAPVARPAPVAVPTAPPLPPAPPASGPPPTSVVGNVVDTTRELSESLPAPVGPVVKNTVDPILGPRQ